LRVRNDNEVREFRIAHFNRQPARACAPHPTRRQGRLVQFPQAHRNRYARKSTGATHERDATMPERARFTGREQPPRTLIQMWPQLGHLLPKGAKVFHAREYNGQPDCMLFTPH
jgi:hypothetical protein